MNIARIDQSGKLSTVASKLRKNFELWNYREVLLPAIEQAGKQLDKGTKFTDGKDFYLVKPDITSQILTGLKEDKEYKLFYLSEVLDGGTSGDWQFGAEYVGGEDRWMILEILTGIITALEFLKVEDFFIDIGSSRVWESVTEEIPEVKEDVFRALHHRSFDLIDEADIPDQKRKEIWRLFNYRDKTCDYQRLDSILEVIDDDRLFADFGTIRGLPYYEDLTFEIYSPELGSPLGGGGEYKFGNTSCCGFAFHLENLLEIFTDGKTKKRVRIDGEPGESFNRAKDLVKDGVAVKVKS